MAGNRPIASSAIVDSRPPPHGGYDLSTDSGTMAMQAGGNTACVQYVRAADGAPPRPSREDNSGPWGAIMSFFGIRKAAPTPKRPASVELRPGPNKPPREDGKEAALVAKPQPEPIKPAKPFPIMELPFELLCEVMARVPAGERHCFRVTAPLATTCKAFHRALQTVSAMAPYKEEDTVARRIAGIRWQRQIGPMVGSLIHTRPFVREWAMRKLVTMTTTIPVSERRDWVIAIVDRAEKHSQLWALEVMRHLARHLPDKDSEALTWLTQQVVNKVPQNDAERFARVRVLAQLAQRISPNDLPGSVKRWESIYNLMPDRPRYEDYLTLRALSAGFRHLSDKFGCKFSVDSDAGILCRLIGLSRLVDGPESDRYIEACTAEELALLRPPEPLPGTVPEPDPLRAYSTVMARPIPRIQPLPSHIM